MPEGERHEALETQSVPSPVPIDWARVTDRVSRYLQSMGVRDAVEIGRLSDQVRVRLESRAISVPLEDPLESAIEETIGSLDQWLVAELGLDADLGDLPAARAAVLDGAVTGWSARWAGLSDRPLAEEIRAHCLSPVPDLAPLVMEPSSIVLCCHRLRCRIVESLGRVLCRPASQGQSGERG